MANPLSDLPLSDEDYEKLSSKGLLSSRGIRDYLIREKYKKLRANKVLPYDALEIIHADYPELQLDSLRRIIYKFPIKGKDIHTPYHLIKEEA